MSYTTLTLRRASKILGYDISNTAGIREFSVINNTIYTDLFTGDVNISGYTGVIKKAFNGKIGATDYFNEIILDDSARCLKSVELSLSWGGTPCFYSEIDGLLKYVDSSDINSNNSGISSKKIEDFSISFKTADEKANDDRLLIDSTYSFYVRKPLIITISSEKKHDEWYF